MSLVAVKSLNRFVQLRKVFIFNDRLLLTQREKAYGNIFIPLR
jgi:hypothetical protein